MIKDLSILIPALDEEESLPSLVEEIELSFSEVEINYEIIIVDDFSETPVSTTSL